MSKEYLTDTTCRSVVGLFGLGVSAHKYAVFEDHGECSVFATYQGVHLVQKLGFIVDQIAVAIHDQGLRVLLLQKLFRLGAIPTSAFGVDGIRVVCRGRNVHVYSIASKYFYLEQRT